MTAAAPTEALWPQLTVIAAVAASHMSMPNHWLPYSLVARAHSWTLRKALFLTFLGALGHVSNTILISVLISEIGGALISHEDYRLLSSSILLLGGAYYLYTYTVQRKRSSCCEPSQSQPAITKGVQQGADSPAVHRTAAISVVMLTALSPCVGSMPVLVSVMAPPLKVSTVMAAGAVLLGTSVVVMCSLVGISYLGAATLDFTKIRRHERLMLGIGLVILAGLTFFVFAGGHHEHRHDSHEHHGHNNVDIHGGHASGDGVTERMGLHEGDHNKGQSQGDCKHDVNKRGQDRTWKDVDANEIDKAEIRTASRIGLHLQKEQDDRSGKYERRKLQTDV